MKPYEMPRIILDSCRNPLFGLIYEASLLSNIEEVALSVTKKREYEAKIKPLCDAAKLKSLQLAYLS